MARPSITTVTVDIPQDGPASGVAAVAPYVGLAMLALFSGMLAMAVAFTLRRLFRSMPRGTCTVAASIISVIPIMGLVLVVGTFYEGGNNPIYTLATLLPAMALCAGIALVVSAPLAWLVAGSRNAVVDTFE